jgi:anti-sigma regulatory factor (Ser/Thr protein kinase)
METLTQPSHESFTINSDAAVGAARRHARSLAAAAGLDETRAENAAIVATELATNVLLHAGGKGEVLVRRLASDGVELIAIDRGGGMRDVDAISQLAMPGRSGLGGGLGAITRLADIHDAYSSPANGTAVLAQVLSRPPCLDAPITFGGVSVPMSPGQPNGDAWVVATASEEATALEAIRHFARYEGDAATWFGDAHEALRASRGGVAMVASLAPTRERLVFVGVGNIQGRVVAGGQSRGLLSAMGMIGGGARLPKLLPQVVHWPPGATLILSSDGVRSQLSLDGYRCLLEHHPSLIAAVLLRDFRRAADDSTVVVLRDRVG